MIRRLLILACLLPAPTVFADALPTIAMLNLFYRGMQARAPAESKAQLQMGCNSLLDSLQGWQPPTHSLSLLGKIDMTFDHHRLDKIPRHRRRKWRRHKRY